MNTPWLWLAFSIVLLFFSFYLVTIEKKISSAFAFIVAHLIATFSLIAGYGIFMVALWTITNWSFWPLEISFILVCTVMSPLVIDTHLEK